MRMKKEAIFTGCGTKRDRNNTKSSMCQKVYGKGVDKMTSPDSVSSDVMSSSWLRVRLLFKQKEIRTRPFGHSYNADKDVNHIALGFAWTFDFNTKYDLKYETPMRFWIF